MTDGCVCTTGALTRCGQEWVELRKLRGTLLAVLTDLAGAQEDVLFHAALTDALPLPLLRRRLEGCAPPPLAGMKGGEGTQGGGAAASEQEGLDVMRLILSISDNTPSFFPWLLRSEAPFSSFYPKLGCVEVLLERRLVTVRFPLLHPSLRQAVVPLLRTVPLKSPW
jgi:hypothetical protein